MKRFLRFSLRSLLLLVLAGASGATLYLNSNPWRVTLSLTPTGHGVKDARFSPDGRLILTHAHIGNGEFNRTTVWSRSGEKLVETDWCRDMGSSGYDGAKFKYGSRWVLLTYAHQNTNSQLLDMQSNAMLFPENCDTGNVTFTRDERYCATDLTDEQNRHWLAVYDLESGKVLHEERAFFAQTPRRRSAYVRINPDGTRVAMQCEEFVSAKTVRLFLAVWDLKSGILASSRHGNSFFFDYLAFSPDGSRLILLDKDAFRVLDVATDTVLFERSGLEFFEWEFQAQYAGLRHLVYKEKSGTFALDLSAPQLSPKPLRLNLECSEVDGDWLGSGEAGQLVLTNLVTDETFTATHAQLNQEGKNWKIWRRGRFILFDSHQYRNFAFDTQTQRFFYSLKDVQPSPDGKRVLAGSSLHDFEKEGDPPLMNTPVVGRIEWAPDSAAFVSTNDTGQAEVWSRMRDDSPGGLLRLPELWLTLVLAVALVFSLRADGMSLRKKPAVAVKP